MVDPRREVALGCRVLAQTDQGDLVWGHVSARDPEGDGAWMKRSTLGFDEVTVDDVVLVSRSGEVVAGRGRRHAEYPIHTEVLAARPDVAAVVHSHAPHAVAFAALGVPLAAISHEATLFTPPDVARFTATGDLILTPELGRAVAGALGDRNALLLVNHGIVTCGPDVATAVVTAVLLDRACRMQLRAMAAGPIRNASDPEEALRKRDHCYPPDLLRQAWDYLVRRAGGPAVVERGSQHEVLEAAADRDHEVGGDPGEQTTTAGLAVTPRRAPVDARDGSGVGGRTETTGGHRENAL